MSSRVLLALAVFTGLLEPIAILSQKNCLIRKHGLLSGGIYV